MAQEPESAIGSTGRAPAGANARKGFISYAHDDADLFKEFQKHLKVVSLTFPLVRFQADPSIHGGLQWEEAVMRMIAESDIFILLLSPNFLASDFILEKELPAMRDRHQRCGALRLPVVLRRCMTDYVCKGIQPVPNHAKRVRPILDWRPREDGFIQAQTEIMNAIEGYCGMRMETFDWSAK